jgi:hypothetical protein
MQAPVCKPPDRFLKHPPSGNGLPEIAYQKNMRASQTGFVSPRSIVIMIILLAIMIIALIWLDNKAERQDTPQTRKPTATSKAAAHTASSPKPSITAAIAEVHNPDAFGMTWGWVANDKLPSHLTWMSCHGQPREGLTKPHQDSCNPYEGDSSCRLALPILCIQQDGSVKDASLESAAANTSPTSAITDGWAQGFAGSTEPVAGFVIGSLALANARCEKELGPGWRMAEFHDGETTKGSGQGGWGFVAKRGTRLDTRLRHWVHINNQPGNCWNNKGK